MIRYHVQLSEEEWLRHGAKNLNPGNSDVSSIDNYFILECSDVPKHSDQLNSIFLPTVCHKSQGTVTIWLCSKPYIQSQSQFVQFSKN